MEFSQFGKHESVFLDGTEETNYPKLEQDSHADIAIVGGGMVGMTLAYILRHCGQKVVVLEANRIASGMTAKSTAKLTIQHNLIYDKLMHTKSPGKAKQYADANQKAIDFVKELIKREHIDCDFEEMPSYVYTMDEKQVKKIKDEVEACKRLGIDMEYEEELPLNLPIKAAIKWQGAALFHPRKFLLHLAKDFVEAGGKIYEQTLVTDLLTEDETCLETENGCHIDAGKVIIASHFPIYDGLGFYFSRLNMKREYVIAVEVPGNELPKGSFISVEDPIYSIRPVYEKKLVLIGGSQHRVGEDQNERTHFDSLKDFSQKVFHTDKVVYHWSTQDYTTSDNLPYIGYLNSSRYDNIYVATGFNKWGMTGGISAALVLKDMLLTGKSEFEDLFNPKRSGIFSGQTFMQHNFAAIKNYIQGKLRTVPKETLPQKGEAITTKLEDGNTYGIYQDEEENYHIVELTCPHVGATLRWNSAEKSWDCPVHGSRFSIDGEVLNGPSTHPLNGYKEGKNEIHPNLY